MKLNLKDLNPGVFFPFDEDKEDEGGVFIRLANTEVIEEINKKCTKKKVIFRRGQRHEVTEDDEARRSALLWKYVIFDWKGLEDEDGHEIPCNDDNKILLMRKSVKFSSFVGDCIEKLTEEVEVFEEGLEKNVLK